METGAGNCRLWVARIGLFVCLLISGPALHAQAARPNQPVAMGSTISVLYLDNTAQVAEFAWLSKGLADMIATDLGSGTGVTLVEREQLHTVLTELELGLSGLIDPTQAFSVGKLLNAEILVYGSFIVSGTSLRVDLKAVRAETGQVLVTASTTRTTSDALLAQRELSEKLALGLGITLPPVLPEPVKQEAARDYYTGLSYLDEGQYTQALELFKSAQNQDPSFIKAGQGIEDAYRYLKDFRQQRYRREMNVLAARIEAMKARIKAPVFYTFADMITRPQDFGFSDAAAASTAYQSNPEVYFDETPTQAIWGLQHLYMDLRSKAMEYFEDQVLNDYCAARILQLADAAEDSYPKDPFLPEVLYNRFFVYRDYGQWQQVKDLGELIMGDYPDYRMMWAVEGFYEEALEKLGG